MGRGALDEARRRRRRQHHHQHGGRTDDPVILLLRTLLCWRGHKYGFCGQRCAPVTVAVCGAGRPDEREPARPDPRNQGAGLRVHARRVLPNRTVCRFFVTPDHSLIRKGLRVFDVLEYNSHQAAFLVRPSAPTSRTKNCGHWPMAETPRAGHLRRTYGITEAQYDLILQYQGGVCFICERPPPPGKNLQVDHDHKTNLLRGLLCWSCNHRFIGRERNPVRFDRGAKYLRRPPAQEILGAHVVPTKPKRRKRRSK